ncbi:MAG: acyl-ACP--UDP-N-acetylglucosamine O-acyltransferase [SAR86 cluster bacterium]|nr:acyl-ACP--UDP-N-acetylglucosamine O-acyltransferase [SAR86 cluster bacterium]
MTIHTSAIISPTAKIDSSVEIGPFCIIGDDVEIDGGSSILSHCVIKGPTKIGKNNTIYQFSSIGEDTPDKKYQGEKTELVIGDNNIFREGVTVHRGTIQDKGITTIGNDNLFMAYTHIAHDCSVGNSNVFANNAGIAGHVTVGNFVTIGGYSAVHQFCMLGDYSFVGMNSSITMDIPAYVKAASNPARVIGLNTIGMSRNNISSESISLIKKAYKLIYKKGYRLDDAINKIDLLFIENNDELLNLFIESIKSSTRGILR